jgi:hypothetical protein
VTHRSTAPALLALAFSTLQRGGNALTAALSSATELLVSEPLLGVANVARLQEAHRAEVLLETAEYQVRARAGGAAGDSGEPGQG